MSIFSYTVTTNKGTLKSLEEYRGNVMLIVNTASKCAFTSQFKELQDLYSKYQENGLEILGFPTNQFGNGDKGTDEEIQSFCQLNYGVTFPIFSKIEVNGPNADPLFQYLKKEATGILGTEQIKWNFTKFLVDQNGKVIKRYGSKDKPSNIENDLKALINR
ncbi:glutathione peroxidase [Sutcliffiella halmapala]|uniref:glutathione peroxidase n=1 Tax=Sutcliffiella halmapala TaxID=79882 RepID=UPI000994AB8B|nr:glutathione peroxidase [Sutcliffiella halmapala]